MSNITGIVQKAQEQTNMRYEIIVKKAIYVDAGNKDEAASLYDGDGDIQEVNEVPYIEDVPDELVGSLDEWIWTERINMKMEE